MKHNPILSYWPHALVLRLVLALVVVSCFPISNICLFLTLHRLMELWVHVDTKAYPRSCLLDRDPPRRRDLGSIEALYTITGDSRACRGAHLPAQSRMVWLVWRRLFSIASRSSQAHGWGSAPDQRRGGLSSLGVRERRESSGPFDRQYSTRSLLLSRLYVFSRSTKVNKKNEAALVCWVVWCVCVQFS